MSFITYVDRVNIATAATAIKSEFGLNNTELGRVLGAFGLAYALFQIVGGWIGDKFGPRRTLFVCALVWSAATSATSLVGDFSRSLVVRFVLGLREGATFPTATRAMTTWFGQEKRGFAQASPTALLVPAMPWPRRSWPASCWRSAGVSAFVILGGFSLDLGHRLVLVLPR